jgi:hypothetical protein
MLSEVCGIASLEERPFSPPSWAGTPSSISCELTSLFLSLPAHQWVSGAWAMVRCKKGQLVSLTTLCPFPLLALQGGGTNSSQVAEVRGQPQSHWRRPGTYCMAKAILGSVFLGHWAKCPKQIIKVYCMCARCVHVCVCACVCSHVTVIFQHCQTAFMVVHRTLSHIEC